MADNVRVLIGQIIGAHGVRGEVKLRPLTDYPERFLTMKSLKLYRQGRPVGEYPVEQMREMPAKGTFLAALSGIEDMDQADALRGCTVEILPEERVPLAEGEYWISDLVGLSAHDECGQQLGTVKDIIDSGTSLLIVITDGEGKEHMIPAVPEFLRDVDLAARSVSIHLIEGLWEL